MSPSEKEVIQDFIDQIHDTNGLERCRYQDKEYKTFKQETKEYKNSRNQKF